MGNFSFELNSKMSDKHSSTKKAEGDKSSADKKESTLGISPMIGVSTTPMSNVRSGPAGDHPSRMGLGDGLQEGHAITESALAYHAEIDTGIGCSEMAYLNALMNNPGGRITRHRIKKEEDPIVPPIETSKKKNTAIS